MMKGLNKIKFIIGFSNVKPDNISMTLKNFKILRMHSDIWLILPIIYTCLKD